MPFGPSCHAISIKALLISDIMAFGK
jgi:hypothetical protein